MIAILPSYDSYPSALRWLSFPLYNCYPFRATTAVLPPYDSHLPTLRQPSSRPTITVLLPHYDSPPPATTSKHTTATHYATHFHSYNDWVSPFPHTTFPLKCSTSTVMLRFTYAQLPWQRIPRTPWCLQVSRRGVEEVPYSHIRTEK